MEAEVVAEQPARVGDAIFSEEQPEEPGQAAEIDAEDDGHADDEEQTESPTSEQETAEDDLVEIVVKGGKKLQVSKEVAEHLREQEAGASRKINELTSQLRGKVEADPDASHDGNGKAQDPREQLIAYAGQWAGEIDDAFMAFDEDADAKPGKKIAETLTLKTDEIVMWRLQQFANLMDQRFSEISEHAGIDPESETIASEYGVEAADIKEEARRIAQEGGRSKPTESDRLKAALNLLSSNTSPKDDPEQEEGADAGLPRLRRPKAERRGSSGRLATKPPKRQIEREDPHADPY